MLSILNGIPFGMLLEAIGACVVASVDGSWLVGASVLVFSG